MEETIDRHHLVESGLEAQESEIEDLEISPARYEIVTYPVDYTLEGLVSKYRKGQLQIPGFQRNFVWTLPQASKLIESFLLGLPVPAIFLYNDPTDNTFQVIDGQQRLLSVAYYFEGYFGPPESGPRSTFSLRGLNDGSPYLGKTYEDLQETDESAASNLADAVLRAFVIKQLNPSDNTSMYHLFERLNTGGTQLVSQEIRNCVYHGSLNNLLGQLNRNGNWRSIYGRDRVDKRQRDVELILRFLALHERSSAYNKPMKDFLSKFMSEHRREDPSVLKSFSGVFEETCAAVLDSLGPKPFHIRAGLNVSTFDAVFTAFGANRNNIPGDVKERYKALVDSREFADLIQSRTTDRDRVQARLHLANKALFDGDR